MRTFLVAATGLPTILLTAALVVLLCFWLLVAVGVTAADSFDADLDLRAWGMGGVPVAVALSLLTAVAWSLSVGAGTVVAVLAPADPLPGLLRLVVPVGALFVAWATTCLVVRPLHRPFPDEPGPPAPGEARTGDGVGRRDSDERWDSDDRDPHRRASRDTALRPRDRAA